ncbi:MAG: hypothetical protein QF362_01350 [Candidatus Woesearchaeota archaeon]|jgi:hypothetical protein|nr:hypothetical protein [Candidatus Woesearchaeota archaeon]
MENQLLVTLTIGLAILTVYNLYKLMNKPSDDVKTEINDIINSDKYKVKGRYD